jgi:hypothetical protein
VVIGNAPVEVFTDTQLESLKSFVEQGGGLCLLGGPNEFGLCDYADTELEEILPVWLDVANVEPDSDIFVMKITEEGKKHPILRGIVDCFDDQTGTPCSLADLNMTGEPKPDAQVLSFHPNLMIDKEPQVVIACQDYGKGRTMIITSGSTYRWRNIRGDSVYAQFWKQSLGWLAGPPKAGKQSTSEDSRYADAISQAEKLLKATLIVPFAESAEEVMEAARENLPETARAKDRIANGAAALASYQKELMGLQRMQQLHEKKVVTSGQLKHTEYNLEKAKAKLEHRLRLLQHELDKMRCDEAVARANDALKLKPGDPDAKSLLDDARTCKNMLSNYIELSPIVEKAQVARVEAARAKETLDLTQQLYERKYASDSELTRVRTAHEAAKQAYKNAGASLEEALRTPAFQHPALRKEGVTYLLAEAREALMIGKFSEAEGKVRWILILDSGNQEAKAILQAVEIWKESSTENDK